MSKKIIFLIIILIICSSALFAQDSDNLTVKIAVIGPGDELYFWWGHIALIIEDSKTGLSRFYDYGLFDFASENFFYNFAFGRLLYRCGVSVTERNLANYLFTNRTIVVYTLDLPLETKLKVKEFAEVNVLPENREYFYHHFRDNCSTRIRDIIDFATDGQFKQIYDNQKSHFTLRQHVRRHTWFSPFFDWLLNFLMGQVIDVPITVWDDMFLPAEVGKKIEEFFYIDIYGQTRKLIPYENNAEILFESKGRPAVLDVPRKQWDRQLVFSLVLSAIFFFFFYLYSKNIKAGRILAGLSMSFCGLFFGITAVMLYFMNLFTNHDYTFQNTNMIFCTPLLLAAFPAGIGYALTKNPKKLVVYDELLRIVWLLTVLGVFISMIIKLFPGFYQQNLTDQMLILPIALVFTFQPVGLRPFISKYLFRKKADNNG
ncbi:MAG: DUF4105 domain-containing protein [Treponema sp.]|nr:DUF4105 domain-containing protein [Treponema sp.]